MPYSLCFVHYSFVSSMDSAFIFLLLTIVPSCLSIQCYQCDSNEDISCPSDEKFDTKINALVNCDSFEANVPGQFCMTKRQESPGWNGWIKITRRCASRTLSGVAWGCRWSWDEAGVFTETCYCDEDGCNAAPHASGHLNTILFLSSILLAMYQLFMFS